MKKSTHAITLAAVTGLLFLAAPASATPLTGGSSAPSTVIDNGLTQQVSWHCWNTHRYSHRLHRYFRACGDSGKFKHRTTTSAGLAVSKKAPKTTTSSY
jgi:hypothetical protein